MQQHCLLRLDPRFRGDDGFGCKGLLDLATALFGLTNSLGAPYASI